MESFLTPAAASSSSLFFFFFKKKRREKLPTLLRKDTFISFAELLCSSKTHSLLEVIAFHANEALMSTLGASVPRCFMCCHFGDSTVGRGGGGGAVGAG